MLSSTNQKSFHQEVVSDRLSTRNQNSPDNDEESHRIETRVPRYVVACHCVIRELALHGIMRTQIIELIRSFERTRHLDCRTIDLDSTVAEIAVAFGKLEVDQAS